MLERLTEREKQIAAHLAGGLRVAGVASELGLSENTVRNHLKRAFSKLDLHSQSELVDLLREQPSIVSPYDVVAGLANGADPDLVDEMLAVDRTVEKRIAEAADSATGLEAMKAILRAVLPLDETRRHEWRVRLAAQVAGPEEPAVRQASGAIHRKWARKPLLRIEEFQRRGWVCAELDPDEVRRRLFSIVYASALALLADPSAEERDRQLAAVDRVLDAIAPEESSA